MTKTLVKNFTGLTFALGLLLSSNSSLEANQFECCEPQFECCAPHVYQHVYNPSGWNHCGCNSDNFLDSIRVRADFLWWRASEGGLELGVVDTITEIETNTTLSITDEAREKRPNFRYDPGFRLGFDYICPCSCWDFALNWTHYHTKANVKGIGTGLNNNNNVPLNNTPIFNSEWERTFGLPQESFARWNLDMDLVDLEAGYKFDVSSCLKLRPSLGLRIARVNQGYRVFGLTNITQSSPLLVGSTTTISNSEVKAKCDFLGAGPRLGLDVELNIGCGLSLFGEAAGTIAFGTFRNHSREDEALTIISSNEETTSTTNETLDYSTGGRSLRASRAITDFAFGVNWDHCFCWCNRLHPVSLTVAWEHHAFFKLNQFVFESGNLFSYDKRGDLFTQGLTIGLLVGF